MIIGERIRERLLALGKSQADLARAIGVTPQAVSKMVMGGTTDTSRLYQIARELQTSPEYLTGETNDPSLAARIPERVVDLDEVEIDSIDLGYGMGGTFLDPGAMNIEKARFSRAWLRKFTHSPPDLLFTTEGVGDSMMPTINDHDVVIVDRSQRIPEQGDRIWAMTFGGVDMIKRLRPMPDGTVKISSDNQFVRDEVATDGDLYIVGRVVAVVRRV
jgi:phage repressor protein C with HTH and peptisase S24 domain